MGSNGSEPEINYGLLTCGRGWQSSSAEMFLSRQQERRFGWVSDSAINIIGCFTFQGFAASISLLHESRLRPGHSSNHGGLYGLDIKTITAFLRYWIRARVRVKVLSPVIKVQYKDEHWYSLIHNSKKRPPPTCKHAIQHGRPQLWAPPRPSDNTGYFISCSWWHLLSRRNGVAGRHVYDIMGNTLEKK